MYARLVERSGGSSIDLHRCMQAAMVHPPRPSVPARPGAALALINQHRRQRVRRSNPHSASRTLTVPVPRFPPLAVCVRRPSVYAAPSSWPASANVHNCRRRLWSPDCASTGHDTDRCRRRARPMRWVFKDTGFGFAVRKVAPGPVLQKTAPSRTGQKPAKASILASEPQWAPRVPGCRRKK